MRRLTLRLLALSLPGCAPEVTHSPTAAEDTGRLDLPTAAEDAGRLDLPTAAEDAGRLDLPTLPTATLALTAPRPRLDLDQDGDDDLVVGVPGEALGDGPFSGFIQVFDGEQDNATATLVHRSTATLWYPGSPGISGEVQSGAEFGAGLTIGDFNGDGWSDVAVGAPGTRAHNGVGWSFGMIYVLYGTSGGLTSTLASRWNSIDHAGSWGSPEMGFGESLLAVDIDRDGADELIVGVPGYADHNGPVGGAIWVVYGDTRLGSPWEPASPVAQVILGRDLGITNIDRFGAALAAGDFDRNGVTDLAIGAPGARGMVVGFTNAELGDLTGSVHTWSFSDVASDGGFGASLVAGDFDCDGYDDLAVGAPTDGLRAVRPGAVRVLYGRANHGVATAGSVRFPTTGATLAHGSLFGAALTRGDYDGDACDDLVIGVPGDSAASGAVQIYRGVAGTGPSAASMVRRVQPGAESEAGDAFGETLTTGDFDGDGFDDLAVGVPGEAVGALVGAGAVRLYRGGAGTSMLATPYMLTQGSGSTGVAEAADRFGGGLPR